MILHLKQDQWTEAQQERIELQRARVLEVNRHLSALTDGGEGWSGLPLHMNLAVHSANHPGTILNQNPQVVATLKHRNHVLSEVLLMHFLKLYMQKTLNVMIYFLWLFRNLDKKVKEFQP